jgi:hypothetical protein
MPGGGGAGVTKLTIVAIALLFGFFIGADHAKPLPNNRSVGD